LIDGAFIQERQMLDDIKTRLDRVPARVNHEVADLGWRVRRQAMRIRAEGYDRLWDLQADVLDRAGDILDRAPEVQAITPVVKRVTEVVESRRDVVVVIPEDYASLNAKKIIKLVRELDNRSALLSIRRFELAGKGRKTVLDALDARLERMARPIETRPRAVEVAAVAS
jgi:hypothetical protein